MSNDDQDNLEYNPFADEDDGDDNPSGSNVATGYYKSAFFPKPSSPTATLRRRRSSLSSKSSKMSNTSKRGHSRTLSDVDIPPQSAGIHPLKSALAATIGVFQDTGVTRPTLSRLISEANGTGDQEEEEDPKRFQTSREEEKDVIVHQISPKDSLAGVSLKYGISLANLRRANQLWTSDTIHRRSVLYIPLDQASRAREFLPEPNLILLTPDPSDETVEVPDSAASSAYSANGHYPEAHPDGQSAVPVARVPAKQLTYFPPSTNKSSDSRINGHVSNSLISPSPSSVRSSPKYDASLPNNSLASILTALPISASTRDEIITRLSFDSVSSSFTDRSRNNSDEDHGHELNEVGRNRKIKGLRLGFDEGLDESTMPTPKARPQEARLAAPSGKLTIQTTSTSLPRSSHMRSRTSASPPRFYISQTHETAIRTSQLEPSPNMQIPIRRTNTIGPSMGRKHVAAMERTASLGSREGYATVKDKQATSGAVDLRTLR